MTTIISQLYTSRRILLDQLKNRGYAVDDYNHFSFNEVRVMYTNKQLDMLIINPLTKKKIYIKYHITTKLRPAHVYDYIDDLFNLEEILSKTDDLMLITKDKVSDAMTSSIKKPLIGCYAYGNEIRAKYLEKLIKFAGTSFDKAFLLSAGTETTEAALKLMRMYGQSVGKKNLGIIGIENNWHGRTLGAQMMSSNASQKAWVGKLDNDIYHIPFPYEWSLKGESGESFFNKGINLFTASFDK